jgi:metal-sulfur cluster biosynthetic enzyme
LDEELVYTALRKCHDPEIPVNIVDLGLVYDVRVAEDRVNVKMTLTTQGCGMGGYIAGEAEEQIRALPGVREAKVELVWDPPWDPSMISPAGRRVLGLPE